MAGQLELRPPGAAGEKDFRRLCVRCGRCAAICPHDSIVLGSPLALSGAASSTPYASESGQQARPDKNRPGPLSAFFSSLLANLSGKQLLPTIIPGREPCRLCMKCPPVCPSGALDKSVREPEQVRMGLAHIFTANCYNYNNGVMCWTCYDNCPLRGKAIVLENGVTPSVTEQCTGCGLCEYLCPVNAIRVHPDRSFEPAGSVPVKKVPETSAGGWE